ncbi:MAG: adenylyl-sulfate kinase [Bacteroidetes bacterium]|nr:MAG: adenylyl-sulfate kinase [Bacteroidota bacterium]
MTSNQENNIYTTFDRILDRSAKEKLLNQNSRVIWMTGLSGAGKTTIAQHLELALNNRGYLTQVLDGDNIRSGINNNLGFSEEDRYENIRRIAEVSKLLMDSGIICINSFISPTNEIREMAKEIIGKENFIEVFIDAPLAICEQRDTKGLYEKARKGEIKNFTGIDAPFDKPMDADIVLHTDKLSVKECVDVCLQHIVPIIQYK